MKYYSDEAIKRLKDAPTDDDKEIIYKEYINQRFNSFLRSQPPGVIYTTKEQNEKIKELAFKYKDMVFRARGPLDNLTFPPEFY